MAKYENNYIETLNRRLQDADTRLEILTEYVSCHKEIGHYSLDEGVVKLIIGMPVVPEVKMEETGYAD